MPAELLPAPEPARPRFRPGARLRSAGRVPHAASPRTFRRMPHAFSAAGADPQNVFRLPLFALPEGAPEAPEGACFARAPPPASKGPFECRTGRLGGAMTRRPFLLGKYPACPAVGSGTNRSARICSALRLPMIPAALRCGRTKPLPRPRLPSAGWTETFGRGAALPPPRLQEQRSSAGPCRSLFRRPSVEICPHRRRFRNFCIIFAFGFHANSGLTGFDSRQSLSVSTPSAVWRLVNPDAQHSNGNNSYALAA